MPVRVSAVALAALLIISGCNGGPTATSSASVSSSQTEAITDVRIGHAFTQAVITEGATQKVLTFNSRTEPKPGYSLSLPEGYSLAPLAEDNWNAVYSVGDAGQKGQMSISLISCPKDPIRFFALKNEEELQEKLIAYIFTTDAMHDGQVKGVHDFEYRLDRDYLGTAEGRKAYLVEFLNVDTNTRSVRYFSSNDLIGADYEGLSVRIDLPADETALYDAAMRILSSITRAA